MVYYIDRIIYLAPMEKYLGHLFEGGKCVYCGASEKSVRSFSSFGAQCQLSGVIPKPPEATVPKQVEPVTPSEVSQSEILTAIRENTKELVAIRADTDKTARATGTIALIVLLLFMGFAITTIFRFLH